MVEEGQTQILTYRYRLLPTNGQHRRLRDALEHSRQLYNAALEERIDAYRKTGRGRSFYDQAAALTQLRADPQYTVYGVSMQRAALKAVDQAYRGFFKRGGFPRFKSRSRFRSIGWGDHWGWKFDGDKFYGKGIGSIRVHMHRPFPGAAVSARIKREGQHWYLLLTTEIVCPAANDNPSIGIDMGITNLAALSDGTMIANVRAGRKAAAAIRRHRRALSRCKRGSIRRHKVRAALATATAKVSRQRTTYLHQVSADIASRFGMVAVEKLMIGSMSRSAKGTIEAPGKSVRQKSGLNNAIMDAGWGRLKELLRYKLRLKGGELIEVDPRGTSQACSGCGIIVPKPLAQRWHSCPDCGLSIDRDHNAALNVLHRAVHGPAGHNVGDCVMRAQGKAAARTADRESTSSLV